MHCVPLPGMVGEEAVESSCICPQAGAARRKTEESCPGGHDFFIIAFRIIGKYQEVAPEILAVEMAEGVHNERLGAPACQMARNHKYTLHGTKIALGREICKSFINFALK